MVATATKASSSGVCTGSANNLAQRSVSGCRAGDPGCSGAAGLSVGALAVGSSAGPDTGDDDGAAAPGESPVAGGAACPPDLPSGTKVVFAGGVGAGFPAGVDVAFALGAVGVGAAAGSTGAGFPSGADVVFALGVVSSGVGAAFPAGADVTFTPPVVSVGGAAGSTGAGFPSGADVVFPVGVVSSGVGTPVCLPGAAFPACADVVSVASPGGVGATVPVAAGARLAAACEAVGLLGGVVVLLAGVGLAV
ncbi:hypothetical protein Aab01nite_58130 [Paractinoplanes abujensis]|nr:hypothetical protein Aab01nite_58130 [Actinoplanes abujensis]